MTPPAIAPVLEVLPAAESVEEGAPAEGDVGLGLLSPPTVGVEEPVVVVPVEEAWPEVWLGFVALVWPEEEVLLVLPGFVALGAPVDLEELPLAV